MQLALAPSLFLSCCSQSSSLSQPLSFARCNSSGSRFRAYKVSRGNRGSYYYPYTSSLFPCECMVHIHLPFSPSPLPCRLRSRKKRLLQRPHFLHGKRGPPACVVISIPSHFISVFPALRPPFSRDLHPRRSLPSFCIFYLYAVIPLSLFLPLSLSVLHCVSDS